MQSRVLLLIPYPQVTEHALYSLQLSQNGHVLSLQASCSLTGPVHPAIPATPPMQVLDLILIPSPQDAEQADMSDQFDQTGQASVLQGASSLRSMQIGSSLLLTFMHSLFLDMTPPPHDTEQAEKADHWLR